MKLSSLKLFTEILGWYGVLAILGAYGATNFGYLDIKSLNYQLLNLTGAIGIAIDAYFDKNYQPVVLNVFWAGIAIFALLNIIL